MFLKKGEITIEKVNDRILKVFNASNIKQVEFANKIGVSQAYISKLFKEGSDKTPSERIIKIVCSEFNVSEDWLRYGEGEMFLQADTFSLDEYAKKKELSPLEMDIIKGYIELDGNTRNQLLAHFKRIFDRHSEIAATKEYAIDEEVESYRKELEAEQKGRILSASEPIGEKLG